MSKIIAFCIAVLSLSACSTNYFTDGHNLFLENNYVSAIEQFDLAIVKSENGARITMAELERSESYFALGMMAYEKNNWQLASRLFFLANSFNSDQYLDNCYFQLSLKSFNDADTITTMDYYHKIITFLPKSELIPEIYYKRIMIYLDLDQETLALKDFNSLWNNYYDDQFTYLAHPLIDEIIPDQVTIILKDRNDDQLEASLANLFTLSEYTINHKDMINKEIAKTYTQLAEAEISKKNYLKAYTFFQNSFDFDNELAAKNRSRINAICDGFVENGDNYLSNFKFDKAIENYTMCFQIKPNYQVAIEKISHTKRRKVDAIEAAKSFEIALELELDKNYKQALKKYQESQKLVNDQTVKQKVFEMKNIIRAKKEPRVFAKEIVMNYKKGLIASRVYSIEDSTYARFDKSTVEVSGWKVLFTSNNLKYDVRYDIISPGENYYFVWKVDLRTQELIAMNKRSEKLIK